VKKKSDRLASSVTLDDFWLFLLPSNLLVQVEQQQQQHQQETRLSIAGKLAASHMDIELP
jgi:BarA-like signal transduction histidine kinase